MKLKTLIIAGLLTTLVHVQAVDINIPDGSFENINSIVTPPVLLGTATGSVGAWTAKMSALVNLGGSVKSDTATALTGPNPPDGKYELQLNMPASLLVTASLSQTLTNNLIPNSTYALSFSIDQSTVANLVNGTTISLRAGNTNLASFTGSNLANLIDAGNGFQTLTLTYKTGNTVPTNKIAISVNVTNLGSVFGTIYLDNFKLSVNPTQIQMNSVTAPDKSHFNIAGSGGAPNATYEVVTSTNLYSFTTNWVTATTNKFDANGNYNVTFTIDPNIPQRFFRVIMP